VKALIVGGGGREHALAWSMRRDDPSLELFAAPGNPGIAQLATCVPISATDIDGLLAFAKRESVALTVVGPEAPLAAGIVDRFRAQRLAIFGPTGAAAEIETSKAWAKAMMLDAGVPTARAETCGSVAEARSAIRRFGAPVVIKASGLAAGKGVIVCLTTAEAERAVDDMLEARVFGSAGDTVLVEEFMSGEELSVFVVTDGTRAIPLVAAQDHKRLLDGDRGPNTGGMGAYAPVSLAGALVDDVRSSPLIADVLQRVIDPTLDAMRECGRPFTGLLYAGVMVTDEGPKVVEFNCRFGDPETQAVLPVLDVKPSLLELFAIVARGERLPEDAVVRPREYAVTTVLASEGYPDTPRLGDRIELPTSVPDDVLVFHAGTRRADDGSLVTAGGRVLAVTALASSIADAQRRSLELAAQANFRGKQLRTDIGWRELARHAGAA
jgi:phosphoribosylamine---glycine ligase